MARHRRAHGNGAAWPRTDRELLAYSAGRRMRRVLQLPIGRTVPTPEEIVAHLRPGEYDLYWSSPPARWWALFWRGWREGAPREP